jgi:hypothetical protein
MTTLTDVLRKHVDQGAPFGFKATDAENLAGDLIDLRTQVTRKYWITTTMIAAVFVLEFVLAVSYYASPGVLSGVAGAAGITLAGSIKSMSSLTRESARIGLILILARNADDGVLPDILKMLVEKLGE